MARYRIIQEYLTKILVKLEQKDITILDIGCGDAFLVHQLSQDFPHINFIGVDINFTEELLESVRNNIRTKNLKIFQKLDELEGTIEKVDLILLLDVIEHIEDEISFLKSLQDYTFIRENTPFLITVPAYQKLFAYHDYILEHYRRYSNTSLRDRLRMAGYKTTHERYFFLSLIPPRIIQKILEKISKPDIKNASDLAEWKGGFFITKLLTEILFMDYKLGSVFYKMGFKLPGLSNVVICERSV